MEQLREQPQRPERRAPGGGVPMEPAADVAAVAQDAAAQAAAVPLESSVVTVTVKTTGAHSTRIMATPDTPMTDILTQACRDLGVRDPEHYLLVARGEVINEGRTLGAAAGEKVGEGEITMRLVKKPEAGARQCPS